MSYVARILGVVLASTVILGGAGVSSQAATTRCGTSTGGADVYWQARSASADGRTVVLHSGKGFDESHAHITRGYSPGVWSWSQFAYRNGDRTWVDRRQPGSARWFQCGPFTGAMSNEMDNINYDMRACMDYRYGSGRRHVCTDWYRDHPE